MEQVELIAQARGLVNEADAKRMAGARDQANAHLVELRELLNAQPELEAGGDGEETPAEKPAEI